MAEFSKYGDFLKREIREGLTLFAHPTPRFKTVSLQAVVLSDLGPESTMLALLPQVLRRGTARLPDMQKITRFLEGLYGATLDGDVIKAGEYHALALSLSVLSPSRVPEGHGIVAQAVQFLAELLSEPRLEGDAFPAEVIVREKENHGRLIESLVNNRDQYAWERLVRSMCAGERFSTYEYGTLEGLELVEGASLADFWRRLLASAPIAVAAAGDFDPDRLAEAVADRFAWPRGPLRLPAPPERRPAPAAPRFVEEPFPVMQERVLQGFRVAADCAGADMAASLCFSGLLGGFSFSRLFKVVRETEGLAYDVGSHLERLKGIMVAWAGVRPGEAARAMDAIAREMEDLRQGRLKAEELDAARNQMIAETRSIADSTGALINTALDGWLTGKVPSLADYEREAAALTAEDVARVAASAALDTNFILRPEKPLE